MPASLRQYPPIALAVGRQGLTAAASRQSRSAGELLAAREASLFTALTPEGPDVNGDRRQQPGHAECPILHSQFIDRQPADVCTERRLAQLSDSGRGH